MFLGDKEKKIEGSLCPFLRGILSIPVDVIIVIYPIKVMVQVNYFAFMIENEHVMKKLLLFLSSYFQMKRLVPG